MLKTTFSNGSHSKEGHGTGFWFRDSANEVVFITNRHNLDLEFKSQKYAGKGYFVSAIEIISFDPHGAKRVMNIRNAKAFVDTSDRIDIAIIRFDRGETVTGNNQTAAPASREVIADADFMTQEIEWGAQVTFVSFQPWRDAKSDRPILRTGIVSSDPKHPYNYRDFDRDRCFLIEAFSFEGSSGSPVFANARGFKPGPGLTGGDFRPGKLIGIACGHLKNSGDGDTGFADRLHTGLSYCHQSSLILELVDKPEADLLVIT